jgi:hypothetical protein
VTFPKLKNQHSAFTSLHNGSTSHRLSLLTQLPIITHPDTQLSYLFTSSTLPSLPSNNLTHTHIPHTTMFPHAKTAKTYCSRQDTRTTEITPLIPYISDSSDSEDDAGGGFGECWSCGAALPVPRGGTTHVDCSECGIPN